MRNLTLVPFLLLSSACSFLMGEPQADPAAVASAAPAASASAAATSSEPVATAITSAAPAAPAPRPTKTFSLAEQKLGLSIELPEDAKVEGSRSKDGLGGALIEAPGISLRIVKADARLASIATAKATLEKMIKPAKTFYKEEKDLLVYDRGDGDRYFVFITRVAGVAYACQELGGQPSEGALEPGIAACRSLKKAP